MFTEERQSSGSCKLATASRESNISTNTRLSSAEQAHSAHQTPGVNLSDIATKATKKAKKLRARGRKLTSALVISHIAIAAVIIGVVSLGYKAPVEGATNLASLQQSTPSVDQVAAVSVAAQAAQSADILVQSNVSNLSISTQAKTELAQVDNSVLNKPQILQQNSGKPGIAGYAAQQGDTVQSVAAKFGISEDTVRWANNLTSDALTAGQNLSIPSTTGVVYTVKQGDDPAALASKYQADKDRIITYNSLELTGLVPGAKIIIPDGVLPTNERPGYTSRTGTSTPVMSASRITAIAGNTYDYGYCTWWAYQRRAELGHPVGSFWGNASSWAYFARNAGYGVDNHPSVGAVLQTGGGWGGAGHVAVVEQMQGDGSITVSEMNYAGWGVESTRTISASQAASYNYIH